MNRRYVLMSGYPGSGKSTLAAALAERLAFPLICKDATLMTLYGAFEFGPGDAAASLRTGAAAWAVFWMQARFSPTAVLDTNIQWANPAQRDDLLSLGGRIVEVRCECPPELARQRFAARAAAGHAAQQFSELDDARLQLYARPIGIGELICVDTRGPVDVEAVALAVTAKLSASEPADGRAP